MITSENFLNRVVFRLFNPTLILWLGVVLVIVGCKLWLVSGYGSGVPLKDQIDAEGEFLFRPLLENGFDWRIFFAPHNEHRVVFSKLLAWLQLQVNGQWDAYPQMVINAFIHAAFLPVLLCWVRQRIRGVDFAALAVVTTVLWCLPINWENTLHGFQSSFYFLIWLTFLHLWGVLGAKQMGGRWAAGHCCGLLALGALGAGILSSFAIAGLALLQLLRWRSWDRVQLINLGISAIWITVGLLTRFRVPAHDVLKADSITQFFEGLTTVLTWPFAALMPWAALFAITLIWRCMQIVRQPNWAPFDRVYLGLVVWFMLVAVSTAYLRAQALTPPRYFDQFYLGLLLQGMAVFTLARSKWRWLLAAGWVLALGFALFQLNQYAFRVSLSHRPASLARQENRVREFLETQDANVLVNAPPAELVYPSGRVLADHWSHASINSLLPAAVRPPVDIPAVPDAALGDLPPPPYPVIANSPASPQTAPWTWRSPRLPADTLPVLRFRISGGLGDPHSAISMFLVSENESVEVRPDAPARGRWKTINVVRPAGEWWIELTDSDSIDQIALTAPVELGWLSWASEKMIKYHQVFGSIGIVLIILGFIGRLKQKATVPGPSPDDAQTST